MNHPTTYVAKLHPWAAKLVFKPHLKDIALAHILSGVTCPPISLTDFEAYLAFKEHSLENLQFVVWYQDYRHRFLRLPDSEKAKSPGSDFVDLVCAIPNYAENERRALESVVPASHGNSSSTPATVQQRYSTATTIREVLPPSPLIPTTRSSLLPLLSLPNPPENRASISTLVTRLPTLDNSSSQQPFHEECMRIIATFLRPGATRELSLDDTVRDTVICKLATNTHPDSFLPAYEVAYDLLERTSLPRFLAFASANINRPKQLFWYFVGIANLCISIAIAVCIIEFVPNPPKANRAWRLFALPVAWFGSMQVYAAFRGFCNQVWQRNSMQLHVWEMQEADEESRVFIDRVVAQKSTSGSHYSTGQQGDSAPPIPEKPEPSVPVPVPTIDQSPRSVAINPSIIAPFLVPELPTDATSTNSRKSVCSLAIPPSPQNYRRPPIFGPERVVLDVRIKAVHRQIMNDIWLVGFMYIMVFAGITLSVPSRVNP